jgi:hypothetical protein
VEFAEDCEDGSGEDAWGTAEDPLPRLQANDAANRTFNEMRKALRFFAGRSCVLIFAPSFGISKGKLFIHGSEPLYRVYCIRLIYFQS